MTYKVILKPEADLELLEYGSFIALDNPAKADEFIDSIVRYFRETLASFPEIGVKHFGDIRKLTYRGHTAFYHANHDEKKIHILHIVNLTKPLESRNIKF